MNLLKSILLSNLLFTTSKSLIYIIYYKYIIPYIRYTPYINNNDLADISNSNVRYNQETDMVQIYFGGEWVDWKIGGFQDDYSLIPILTSNTSSSECTVTGTNGYYLFDGQYSTILYSGTITVSFNKPIMVKSLKGSTYCDHINNTVTATVSYLNDSGSYTSIGNLTHKATAEYQEGNPSIQLADYIKTTELRFILTGGSGNRFIGITVYGKKLT